MNFNELGLKQSILDSITQMGFTEPSPIQEQAIPLVLEGKDIIAQAQTGTGKTAAFGLPCLSQMKGNKGVEMLVIAPTRELANQVSDEIFRFGQNDGIKTVTVFGGQSYSQQIGRVQQGAQVVVATPGRLLDLLKGKQLGNFNPSMVVLDEADEMLDMGFLDDIKEIFSLISSDRQTLMFSATMPAQIKALAQQILKDPVTVSVTTGSSTTINKDIEELFCVVNENERDDAMIRIMDSEAPEKAVVFCRTKSEVDRLATLIMGRGYLAKGLHGDMEQRQRETVMRSFQSGQIAVLVATDVAARGLDVKGVSHVINFHIPFDAESYVHRIGRTARAGAKGKAITLASPREWRDLKRIKGKVGSKMTHLHLPTIADVQKANGVQLMEELQEQKIHSMAAEFFETLVSQMGTEQAAEKLMSYILESDDVEGPDSIGLKGQQLDRFFFDLDRPEEPGRGGGGNRRDGRHNSSGFRHRQSGGGSSASYRGGNAGGSTGGGYRGANSKPASAPFKGKSGESTGGGYKGGNAGGSSSGGGYKGASTGGGYKGGSAGGSTSGGAYKGKRKDS